MTYETAKGLKEAGYPILGYGPEYGECGIFTVDGRDYKIPTLSELIEACGERFISLSKNDRGWTATAEISPADLDRFAVMMDGNGPTPDEALANLFIAIKEA